MGMRRAAVGALICLGLVVAVALLAPSGRSRSDAEQGAFAGVDVAGEDLPDAVTVDAFQGAALLDITTGDLVDALNVGPEDVVNLSPGDISGLVAEPDGVTPHAGVLAVLLDASTGEEVMSTVTDERGRYVLTNVAEGRYVVRAGEPGLGAVLVVSKQSEARVLDFLMPEASVAPSPPGSGVPRDSLPLRGISVAKDGGATVVAPLASPGGGRDADDDAMPRRTGGPPFSPPGPPPWRPGPPPWPPGPPPWPDDDDG